MWILYGAHQTKGSKSIQKIIAYFFSEASEELKPINNVLNNSGQY